MRCTALVDNRLSLGEALGIHSNQHRRLAEFMLSPGVLLFDAVVGPKRPLPSSAPYIPQRPDAIKCPYVLQCPFTLSSAPTSSSAPYATPRNGFGAPSDFSALSGYSAPLDFSALSGFSAPLDFGAPSSCNALFDFNASSATIRLQCPFGFQCPLRFQCSVGFRCPVQLQRPVRLQRLLCDIFAIQCPLHPPAPLRLQVPLRPPVPRVQVRVCVCAYMCVWVGVCARV